MLNELKSLFKQIPLKTRTLGVNYAAGNRVKKLSVANHNILGSVEGTGANPYQIRISASGPNVTTFCSCPVGRNCKHVAAVLSAYFSEQPASIKIPEVALEPIQDTAVQNWVQSLDEEESSIQSAPVKPARKLVFCLDVHKEQLALSLHSIKLKKTGQYSKNQQVLVHLQSLWETAWKEITSQFSDEDWDTVYAIQRMAAGRGSAQHFFFNFPNSEQLLRKVINTGCCFLRADYDEGFYGNPISWGASLPGNFAWRSLIDKQAQKLVLTVADDKVIILDTDPACYWNKEKRTIGLVETQENPELVKKLIKAPFVPFSEVNKVHAVLSRKTTPIAKIAPKQIEKMTIKADPSPVLRLSQGHFSGIYDNGKGYGFVRDDTVIRGEILFDYENCAIPYTNKENVVEVVQNEKWMTIHRKSVAEKKYATSLMKYSFFLPAYTQHNDGLRMIFDKGTQNEDGALNQAMHVRVEVVPKLQKAGWRVEYDASFPIKEIFESDEVLLDTVESGSEDWFDVKLGVMIGDERFDLLPILKQVIKLLSDQDEGDTVSIDPAEKINILTSAGRMIKLPKARLYGLARHLMLEFKQLRSDDDQLRLSKWNAGFLSEFLQGESAAKSRWVGSDQLKAFAIALREEGFLDVEPPKGLQCELRSYQKQGLNWLQFLRRSQLNGILADDMGLGKTVQTLAHIQCEKESGRMQLPALVIAPTSLMPNWLNEAVRLTPLLKVLVLHGSERRQHFTALQQYDLILTTYPLLMRDKEFLLAQPFHLMILDEAQTVKNFKTQAYQVVQQIQAAHRICLSGTPMENHLGELWALFHLLLPGFLGDQKTFQTIYAKPIEKLGNVNRREALTRRIKPFILRRTKQQVALDLPEKTEIIQKIELKQGQRELYEAIRLRAQSKVMQEIQKKGLGASQIILLDALLKLRQVCCDPRLVKVEQATGVTESAKLEWLLEMVPQMVDSGRRILIFSQFTSMLALITEGLNEKGIAHTILTGETMDRATPVNRFQAEEIPVMLISLKAGGVGLNLTAADTVIHYDPWWNPSVENQATDRAHRIGQKKAVFVYKLVVSGSLEEKILSLQERKKGLVNAMLDADSSLSKQFSLEDLEDIFKPLPVE